MDTPRNSRDEDTTRHTYGLTQLERALFVAGYEAAQEQWKARSLSAPLSSRRRALTASLS